MATRREEGRLVTDVDSYFSESTSFCDFVILNRTDRISIGTMSAGDKHGKAGVGSCDEVRYDEVSSPHYEAVHCRDCDAYLDGTC